MTSLWSAAPGPAAFLSYAHDDDVDAIAKLRSALELAVRRATGIREFTIFWDQDIGWGQQWHRRVDAGLARTTFFLPIVTPFFFQSEQCRREFREFVRHGCGNTDDRVMPLYYITAREMDGRSPRSVDEVGCALRRLQYEDWRELRFKPPSSSTTRRAINRLAERLRDVIDPHDSMPPAALLPPRPARIDARSSRTVPPGTNGTPLRFLLAIDTSASMDGEKSGMVDHAIRELLPQLRERGGENPHTPVTVEVLTFGSRVSWFTRGRVPLRWFDWSGCRVDTRPGLCLDQALQILAASLSDMPGVAPRPTVVVILGSSPTRDVSVALDRILQEPWVRRSVRLGSFVGDDADRDVLSRFIDHPEIEPLEITRLADVVDYLRFEAVRVESTDDVW